jgi:hypothetical protein
MQENNDFKNCLQNTSALKDKQSTCILQVIFLFFVMPRSSVEKRSAAILAASKMLALPICN